MQRPKVIKGVCEFCGKSAFRCGHFEDLSDEQVTALDQQVQLAKSSQPVGADIFPPLKRDISLVLSDEEIAQTPEQIARAKKLAPVSVLAETDNTNVIKPIVVKANEFTPELLEAADELMKEQPPKTEPNTGIDPIDEPVLFTIASIIDLQGKTTEQKARAIYKLFSK